MAAQATNLTPEQKEKMRALIEEELARRSLLDFTQRTYPSYQVARHHKLLAEHLEAIERRELFRLIVEMPPRHGKSELVSVRFPAWYLGKHPDRHFIACSYSADLAYTFSRQARNLFHHPLWPFPTSKLASDAFAIKQWRTTENGGFVAAGIGGPITGQGADVLSIDDPLKNREDAQSQVIRDGQWDWYKSTARTRLHPGGAIIVCMTRWHEDDLAGRLLNDMKDGGEEWTELKLPAIAEPGDLLGRDLEEPLWPERYSQDALMQLRRTLGAYEWSALYQQRPQPDGGGLFKRQYFQYFREEGDFYILRNGNVDRLVAKKDCRVFAVVDLAISLKTSADYTVIGVFAATPDAHLLVIDIERTRLEGPDMVPLLWNIQQKHNPAYFIIEKVGFQLAIIQEARRSGLPVKEFQPDKDKYTRALPVAARFESLMVWLRYGAAWLDALEHELLIFPNGAHDDQVDVVAGAGLEIHQQEPEIMMFYRKRIESQKVDADATTEKEVAHG